MKFKALFLISFYTFLTACGHVAKELEETAQQPAPRYESADPSEYPPINGKSTNQAKARTQTPAVAKPVVIAETNLIERIRAGFRLPDLQSSHTKQYAKWSAQHPTYLKNLFARAEPFLFHIVEEIEKRDLPTEIALLPAIESAYKPRAVSRSGAVGLWQFVPATGKERGLRQDWWYDGRRDALLATTAALDYLEYLNAMFDGDWMLTFAAYNAGQGTILRAIKANKRKNRKTDYQSLRLRKETQRYVPKLIALKNIIQNPQKYGVDLPSIPNREHFRVVNTQGQVNLEKFAELSALDLDDLLHLNAAHRRPNTTPDGPHQLLVPIAASVAPAVQYFQDNPLEKFQNYRIRRGDSLSRIAKQHGVSVNALKSANNLRGNSIRAGHNLMVPVGVMPSDMLAYNGDSGDETLTHRVKRGDTLWSISKRYRVRVSELMSWNKLSSNQILSLGQSLLVRLN